MQLLAGVGASQSGSFNSIATTTVGSGGATSVTFNSFASTFKHLRILCTARNDTTQRNLRMRFNGDSSTNYSWHQLTGDGGSVASYPGVNQDYIELGNTTGANMSASTFAGFVVNILDYSNPNKYTTIHTVCSFADGSAHGGLIILFAGNWRNTGAVTSIELYPQSNKFAEFSKFALYGIA